VGIAEIRELMIELNKKGHTIIMASHLLDEVEKVCTHVAILKTGSLITTGHVDDVLADEDIVELGAADLNILEQTMKTLFPEVRMVREGNYLKVHLPKGLARPGDINRYCFERNILLTHLAVRKKRLEARFFELTNN
jgi:ABC-2 type transport system ATP-binding protein